MILIKKFRDESKTSRKEKSRAIIACEDCKEEREVRYDYYSDCERNNRKYCKTCQSKHKTLDLMKELNNSNPLSICIDIEFDDKKPIGRFRCTKCNQDREVQYRTSMFKKYCSSCTQKVLHEKNKQHEITHTHRLSRIINNMRERTQNPKNLSYADYGGRGIDICKEWASGSKVAFYDWALANGYQDNLSIDRIDNDKGYSPSNCRWATLQEQQANTRIQKNNTTGYRGVSNADNGNFRARLSIADKEHYIGTFDTPEEANEALQEYKTLISLDFV